MNKLRRRQEINKDDYWMAMAFMLSAGSRSKQPRGCIIVSSNNEPLAMSCDSFVKSTNHVIHAEINSIFNYQAPINNGTVYLTHPPCCACLISLIKIDIKRIVYFPSETLELNVEDIAKCSFVQLDEFKGNLNWIRDHIRTLDIF
jgi:deoxycytidylate deaminase